MQINKNDFIGNLKTPLAELCDIAVKMPRGNFLCVQIVGGHMIQELLKANPHKRSRPECASIENNRMITVFPRTDKRYRLRVVGTQYIEQ